MVTAVALAVTISAVAIRPAAASSGLYTASVMTSAKATGLEPGLMAKLAAAGWTPAAPAAGGPSCQYDSGHIIKTCFQQGKGTIVEVWGSLVSRFNRTEAVGLWGYFDTHPGFRHAVGSCAAGAIGGIIASAATTGGIAVVAGITGGCVTGLLTYWWAR